MVTFLRINWVKGCNFVTENDMTVLTFNTSKYMNHGKVFLALLAFLILNCGSLVTAQRSNVSAQALSDRNHSIPVKAGEPVALPYQAPKRNYTSFAETKHPTNTAYLYKINSAEYQRHPEFGILPYGFPRQNMVEDLEKRTEKSRYFVDPADPKKFTIHQSYGALHYRDANGWWASIDPRLSPSEKEANVYHAPHQPTPTKIDLNKGYTSIQLSAKEELKFNQNVKMYAVKKDGSKELITIIDANPKNTTVGIDGAYSRNLITGLDREVIFEQGNVKTNYILTQALPSLKDIKDIDFITFEEDVELPIGYRLAYGSKMRPYKEGLFTGSIIFNDASGNKMAELEEPTIYDNAETNRLTDGYYRFNQTHNRAILTFAIRADWLLSINRVYPIVLDPPLRAETNHPSRLGFHNNPNSNLCMDEFCGHVLQTNLPAQAQITTVYFKLVARLLPKVILKSGTEKQFNIGIAFQGPCNRIEYKNQCQGNVVANTQPFDCASRASGLPGGDPRDSTIVPYKMENAGLCLDPSCQPRTVDFTFEAYGCNCGQTKGCMDSCYFVRANDWIMYVDGETVSGQVQSTVGIGDTMSVCAGEIITYTADAKYGVPPYQYSWTETKTNQTHVGKEFKVSGFKADSIYEVVLRYGDVCSQDQTETYYLKARAGADVDLKLTPPSCPEAQNGLIESNVLFQNEAKNNLTSGGCPLTKQIEGQIGTGTAIAVERSPYRGGVNKNRLLFLLKPNDIIDVNPEANSGKIASIAFEVTKKVSTSPYENFTIKMGIASNANLTAARLPGIKLDTVFGPTNYSVKQGWNIHELAPGFSWDGKSNIVVDICYENRFPVGGNDEVQVHNVTGAVQNNPTLFTSSNAINLKKSMCGNNTSSDLTTSPQRPNVRLGFCKGYELRPGNVQNMTGTFAQLAQGDYTVLYVDPTGCSFQKTVNLKADSLKYKTTVLQHEFCGKPNGKIQVDITKGSPPFKLTLKDLSNNNLITKDKVRDTFCIFDKLFAGSYEISLEDSNGCQAYLENGYSNTLVINQEKIDVTFDTLLVAIDTCGLGKAAMKFTVGNVAVPPFSVKVTDPDNKVTPYTWMTHVDTLRDLKAGTYKISITDFNGCIMNPEPQEFEIPAYFNFPEAELIDSKGPKCPRETNGYFEWNITKGVIPYTVTIVRKDNNQVIATDEPVNNTTPYRKDNLIAGNYEFTFKDAFGCTITKTGTINAADTFDIVDGELRYFCLNKGTAMQVGNAGDKPAGGTWVNKSDASFFKDDKLGIIDPAKVANGGEFRVYYNTVDCEGPEVIVNITKVDVGSEPPALCTSALEYTPAAFTPAGGSWTSVPVLGTNLDPVTGKVKLNYNVPADKYKLIYTVALADNQECSNELTLTINDEPVPGNGYEIYRCLNNTTPEPLGHPDDIPSSNEGEWICKTIPDLFSNPTGGVLDRSKLQLDEQDIEVFYRNINTGCESRPITLKIRKTNVGANPVPKCPEGTFTPEPATPSGGTWSSTDISGIDATTGAVSLAGLSAGDYKLIYTMSYGNTACPETLTVTVKEQPVVGGAPNRVYCKGKDGNTVDLSNPNDKPQGGTWINADNIVTPQGIFNLDQANKDTFNVYYVANGCTSEVVTVRVGDVQIPGSPNPSACEADDSFTLPNAMPAGGAWSSTDSKVVITNGAVVLGNSLQNGRYKLIYQQLAGDPNSCRDTIELTVKPSPKLRGNNNTICITAENINNPFNLTNERPVNINGGIWSNGPGHSLITDGILGKIDLNDPAIQPGQNYPVTYTSPAPDNCDLKFNLVFSKMNAGDDLLNVCENLTNITPKNFNPAGKFWFAEDNSVIINANTGEISLDRSLPAGDYKIFYVEDLSNKATACKDELKLTVIPAPKAEFDVPRYPENRDHFLIDVDPITLSAKNTATDWSYLWEMGDGTTYTTDKVTHTYKVKGTKTVQLKITHQNACVDSVTQMISIEEPVELSLPSVISSNGDGINDDLIVPTSTDYKVTQLFIKDRFGNKAYTFPDDGNKWTPGNDIAAGVYFYMMEITNVSDGKKTIKSGNITIIR